MKIALLEQIVLLETFKPNITEIQVQNVTGIAASSSNPKGGFFSPDYLCLFSFIRHMCLPDVDPTVDFECAKELKQEYSFV